MNPGPCNGENCTAQAIVGIGTDWYCMSCFDKALGEQLDIVNRALGVNSGGSS